MQDPSPLFTLALYQPDIPQNAGAMLRLCACLSLDAALILPAGFPVGDRRLRRAGMDYIDHARLSTFTDFAHFQNWRRESEPARRLVLLSTKAALPYSRFSFRRGDVLMVGRESSGVPDEVFAASDAQVRIPMRNGMRSINVAMAAAIVIGEAVRQIGAFSPEGPAAIAEKGEAHADQRGRDLRGKIGDSDPLDEERH